MTYTTTDAFLADVITPAERYDGTARTGVEFWTPDGDLVTTLGIPHGLDRAVEIDSLRAWLREIINEVTR